MPKLDFDVDPDEVRKQVDEHVPPEDKAVPTRRLVIVAQEDLQSVIRDIGQARDDHYEFTEDKILGYIDEPTSFCPGIHCPHGRDSKNPLSFHKKDGTKFWVHSCGLPSRAWWEGHVRDMITPLIEDRKD